MADMVNIRPTSHPNMDVAGTQAAFDVKQSTDRSNLDFRQTESAGQLAIIGDVSTGKTSLFEALTGLALPPSRRPQQTNFTIHAKLRRTTDGSSFAKATIQPGPREKQYSAAVSHLLDFLIIYHGDFNGDALIDITQKAAAHMCISVADDDQDEEGTRPLSDNILVIDIAGPDLHNLSVIDFPGIVQNTYLYFPHEVDSLHDLMMYHLMDPNTIIVAVVDATRPIPNQTALQMARLADPTGQRTVGVLTKCDLVPQDNVPKVLRVFGNKQHHLAQGWFAVNNSPIETQVTFDNNSVASHKTPHERNDCPLVLDSNDIPTGNIRLQHRNAAESIFFSRPPWNSLKTNGRAGVAALHEFLQDLIISTLQYRIYSIMGQMSLSTPSIGRHDRHISELPTRTDDRDLLVNSTRPIAVMSREAIHCEKEDPGDESNDAGVGGDLEAGPSKKRPTILYNSVSVTLTIILTLSLVGLGCEQLAQEIATDGDWTRLFLLLTVPVQIFVSLFFCQSIINTVAQMCGPVSQLQINSKFYSAHPVKRLDIRNGPLPHVTIQCPVYKEGLDAVIRPTVASLEAAIRHYRSCGGTANMFFNDDGMQLLSPEDAAERKQFYRDHDIGWVARPAHAPGADGLAKFIRRGKFKKASNMNYALGISIKVEDRLATLANAEHDIDPYQRCLEDVLKDEKGRAWAEGDIRVGDYILIVDSDTRIPETCMIDAVSELEESPQVAILQFSSGVMNVTTSYFEMGITFFTDLIYTAIRFAVASGDIAPFVGHNAFLRWSALQEVSFLDSEVLYDNEKTGVSPGEPDCNSTTPYEKFWSESHVSEDFDISLRLQTSGYHVRLGAYYGGDFKEGVSLTVYDELARWEKYAYGCSELLFHPLRYWPRRGVFTPLFRRFIVSSMPLGSKVSVLAYIGTYYAIGYAWIGSLLNYFLIGWYNGHLDHYYMNSWRVWVALVVVFSGAGNLALAIVRYRGEGYSNLLKQLWIAFRWVPLLFVFFGGISMHVGQAILSHMLSIDMSWGATAKEVSDTSFFIEMPMIIRRFKFAFLFCLLMLVLIICGAYGFPYLWRIDQLIAIFPLSCVIVNHFLLPVLLNPALMKFTW